MEVRPEAIEAQNGQVHPRQFQELATLPADRYHTLLA